MKWFEGQFYSLQESAQAELTRKGVTVQDFRQSLARLSSSIKAEHEKFVKEKYDTFQKAKSIEEIFVHLNFYLGFIDFSLLEHNIDHFGSSDLKEKMGQYSLDMVQFRKTTTVAEIFPHLSGRPEPPPEYVKLEMEFDYDPHTGGFGASSYQAREGIFTVKVGALSCEDCNGLSCFSLHTA